MSWKAPSKRPWLILSLCMAVASGCGHAIASEKADPENALFELAVGSQTFLLNLEDSEAADSLIQRLPLKITMSELNGNEKYYQLGRPISSEKPVITSIQAGDFMLYSGSYLVLFYESIPRSAYSYERLGKILDTSGLADALGTGDVTLELRRAE